jgi:hypothetical protein
VPAFAANATPLTAEIEREYGRITKNFDVLQFCYKSGKPSTMREPRTSGENTMFLTLSASKWGIIPRGWITDMSSFKPGRLSHARLTHDAVTPKNIYLHRRQFMAGLGALATIGTVGGFASSAFADPLKAPLPTRWMKS